MTWPSGTKASTTNVDAGTDRIADARPDIKQNIDNVNEIIDFYDADGPYATQGNYTKQQYFGLVTLVEDSSGTVDWDCSVAQTAKFTANSGSITIYPQGAVAGATYILILNGAAVDNLSINGALYPNGISPSFAASTTNVVTMIYDGSNFLTTYVEDLS
jgi:hypothetical protein